MSCLPNGSPRLEAVKSENPTYLKVMQKMFKKSISENSVFKDFPRLANRIIVTIKGDVVFEYDESMSTLR